MDLPELPEGFHTSYKLTTPFGWFDVVNEQETAEFLHRYGHRFVKGWAEDVRRMSYDMNGPEPEEAVARYLKKWGGIMVEEDV